MSALGGLVNNSGAFILVLFILLVIISRSF